MDSAIGSLYLVRYQVPLKTRINLFQSLVLSHLDFSAIFFKIYHLTLLTELTELPELRDKLGHKICFMKNKYDIARDLLLENTILPAEFLITRVS